MVSTKGQSTSIDIVHRASDGKSHSDVVLNNAKKSYPTADANKLAGIEALSEVNNISDVNVTDLTDAGDSALHFHSSDRSRTNHSGTQAPSTIVQDASNRFVTDTEKGIWNGKQDALGFTPEDSANKNQANGYAGLISGKISSSQIPAIAITEVFSVADITARDALVVGSGDGEVQEGDVAIVTDASADVNIVSGPGGYIYSGSAWLLFKSGDDVLSINGNTGIVVLDTDDVTEGSNKYYTEAKVSANASVSANTTHKSSDGSDHDFIDQAVKILSDVIFKTVTSNLLQADDSDGLKLFNDSGEGILIDDAGKVGIGAIDLLARLHVKDYLNFQAYFEGASDRGVVLYFGKDSLSGTNDFVDFRFTADDTSSIVSFWRAYLNGDMLFDSPGKIEFNIGSGAGEDFIVDTSKLVVKGDTGNVGVGLDDPTAFLDIAASESTRASLRMRDGVAPIDPDDGDIWRKIVPADAFGNPATDALQIKNTVETFDILAPHLSGDNKYVNSLDDLPAPESLTYLDYSGQTGDFTLGQVLLGAPSGATGVIIADKDNGTAGKIVVKSVTGTFTTSDTITDPITGNADVDVVTTSGATKILLEDRRYSFRRNFLLPYTLYIPTNVSATIFSGGIFYIGGVKLFESTDIGSGVLYVVSLTLVDAIGSASLFDILGSGVANSVVRIDNSVVVGFNSIGLVSEIDTFLFLVVKTLGIGDGITLNSISTIATLFTSFTDWQNNSTTMLSITGTNGVVNTIGNTFRPESNEKMFNFDSAATFESGIVTSNTLNLAGGGSIFESGSKTQTDVYWTYSGNSNLPDSTVSGQGSAEPGSPITTDIPAIGAQILLDLSTNWIWENEERITGSTTGVLTSDGFEDVLLLLDGNIAVDAGTNQKIRVQFVKIFADNPRVVTFTNATNLVNEISTPRNNGDRLTFHNSSGTLPTGYRKDANYYVRNKVTNGFELSYTAAGPIITISDDGTPTNSYDVAELHGGIGRGTITGSRQLIPQAEIDMSTDQQIGIVVWNDTSTNDIDSDYGYSRLKK